MSKPGPGRRKRVRAWLMCACYMHGGACVLRLVTVRAVAAKVQAISVWWVVGWVGGWAGGWGLRWVGGRERGAGREVCSIESVFVISTPAGRTVVPTEWKWVDPSMLLLLLRLFPCVCASQWTPSLHPLCRLVPVLSTGRTELAAVPAGLWFACRLRGCIWGRWILGRVRVSSWHVAWRAAAGGCRFLSWLPASLSTPPSRHHV